MGRRAFLLLTQRSITAEQREYIKTVRQSSEALLLLLNDILDFSKIEAGELDIEEIEFDPELVAYDTCDLLCPKIGSKPIELLCHIGNDVPCRVTGDPLRFKQVLLNLMGNASKFTTAGEIALSLDVEREEGDRTQFHVRVRDTGIGIPKDKVRDIFEPFQQGDSSVTRQYGGTGLGLSICKSIVGMMQGDLWVESPAGGGLKATMPESAGSERRSDEQPGSVFHFTAWFGKCGNEGRVNGVSPATLSGKRVLIVDDNRANLVILSHILNRAGMRVVALGNGGDVVPALEEAVERMDPFALGVVDIQMPGMSGYEVAERIRASEQGLRQLPLIALSSLLERDAQRCGAAGFDGFLNKPIRREKLYRMMERILGERMGGEAKGEAAKKKVITRYSVREEMKRAVRILVAEDNPVNQILVSGMLEKAGYMVEVAGNGREAVEKVGGSADGFDLVFMDVQMPEMDGITATREIRGLKGAAGRVPIVAMTANAMKGDREMCIEAGMDDYMSKPIKREMVLETIKKVVFEKKKS